MILPGILAITVGGCTEKAGNQPNILMCIADDVSYPHMGERCRWINTPAFNQVARDGILFSNAYTPNAKCGPSRSCILTGRNSWQLREAANHFCFFPADIKTFPEALMENGYYVGYTGKGWAPGDPGMKNGVKRELIGKDWNTLKTTPPTRTMSAVDYTSNFIEFYKNKPEGKPFFFWYGSHEPHRKYEYASSLKAGKRPDDIEEVPPVFPDNDSVRTDLLDYALEIEYFDLHVERMIGFLKEQGELHNTIIVVTSDNGMPFPHAKSDAYDYSTHLPLAIMWGKGIKRKGRTANDYVSFIDFAPTFLEVAGINPQQCGMMPVTGKSLVPLFRDLKQDKPFRDCILVGKERHDVGRPRDMGYPIRGIIQDGWLYLVNYRNDLWPAGNPQTGYPTVCGGPTKTAVLHTRTEPSKNYLWEMSFGKRPSEELYFLKNDPHCISNLAGNPECLERKNGMRQTMETQLRNEDDPRMFGNGDMFHKYLFSDPRWRNAYERIVVQKEDLVLPWINASDMENDWIDD